MRSAILALTLAAPMALAQSPVTDDFTHEPQAWFGFFGQKKLPDSVFVFWLDLHARVHAPGNQTNVLLRPGVGVRFRPDMTVWLGYAWTPLIRGADVANDEHRIWQQWTWDIPFDNGIKLQLRSRLEQRFARGAQALEVGVRFRQFIRVQSPRYGRVLLAAWDEAFFPFNDTSWGQQAGFDQNRLFGGVGVFVTEALRFEGGYMNQLIHRRDAPDPIRHVAMLNLFASW